MCAESAVDDKIHTHTHTHTHTCTQIHAQTYKQTNLGTPAWNGKPTWKIAYNGKVFVTDAAKKVVSTACWAKKKRKCTSVEGVDISQGLSWSFFLSAMVRYLCLANLLHARRAQARNSHLMKTVAMKIPSPSGNCCEVWGQRLCYTVYGILCICICVFLLHSVFFFWLLNNLPICLLSSLNLMRCCHH
jgi:hypothetical protein